MSKAGIADTYAQRWAMCKNVRYIKDNPTSYEAKVAQTTGCNLTIPDDFGDPWNSSLESIDWFFDTLKDMGITYTKDWAMPRFGMGLLWESRWNGGPIVLTEDLDWSGLDRGVQKAVANNQHIHFMLQSPVLNASRNDAWAWYKSISNKTTAAHMVVDNFLVPYASFIANRYKDYTDHVSIIPISEWDYFLLPNYYSYSAVPSTADFQVLKYMQKAVYEAVKAAAPNMKVHSSSRATESIQASNLVAYFNGQVNNGILPYFDDFTFHFYPEYFDGGSAAGYTKGTYLKTFLNDAFCTQLQNAFTAAGRPNMKLIMDECGSPYWGGLDGGGGPGGEPGSQGVAWWKDFTAKEYAAILAWAETNPLIKTLSMWRFWGSTRSYVSGWYGNFAHQNIGVFTEGIGGAAAQTKTPVYDSIKALGLVAGLEGVAPPAAVPATFKATGRFNFADLRGNPVSALDAAGREVGPCSV